MLRPALALVSVLLLTPTAVLGQQTIFNHPSADVLGTHDIYLEIDATHRLALGFEGLAARGVVGAADGFEVGLNLGPFLGNGIGGEVTITPNAKARLFSKETTVGEVSGIAGSRVYLPASLGSSALEGYLLLASRTPFGLRVALGVYGEALVDQDRVGRAGVTASAEMALMRHLTVAAEWWQGRDLGVGVAVPVPDVLTLSAAYLLPPEGLERDGLVVEIGRVF